MVFVYLVQLSKWYVSRIYVAIVQCKRFKLFFCLITLFFNLIWSIDDAIFMYISIPFFFTIIKISIWIYFLLCLFNFDLSSFVSLIISFIITLNITSLLVLFSPPVSNYVIGIAHSWLGLVSRSAWVTTSKLLILSKMILHEDVWISIMKEYAKFIYTSIIKI